MIVHPLGLQEQAASGATHRAIITFADFTAAANAQTINIAAVAAKMGARVTLARVVTPFQSADAALISTGITIGDGGSANRLLTTMELNGLAATPAAIQGGVVNTNNLYVYTGADNIAVAFTNTAAKNLNTLTQGELHVLFYLVDGR